MNRGRVTRARGVALLAFVAVVGVVASWFLVKQLNLESGGLDAARKQRNAEVLSRAKLALIGYISAQAAKPGENRPGALPCPEAPGNFNDATNEGTVSFPCTPPTVGRFPWKTLGLDKLVDASGEPLWYVVAPGWAGANTVINSNCATYSGTLVAGFPCSNGRLTVDGVTDDVIALIIAPGPAFGVLASGGNCAAKSQSRPTSGNPDWSNYLECENATYPTADGTFVTTGPSRSFNDQVVKITATELMPMIEAAIAHRIEREIAPALTSMYNGSNSGTSWSGLETAPRFPNAATFANPTTSSMQGVAGLRQGLLPMIHSETTPGSGSACPIGELRCNPTLHTWSAPTVTSSSTLSGEVCNVVFGTTVTCTFYYRCSLFSCTAPDFAVSETATNVGIAMRRTVSQAVLDAATMTNVVATGRYMSGILNTTGSAQISVNGTVTPGGSTGFLSNLLCNITGILSLFLGCKQATISMPTTLFRLHDHALLDSSDATYGWFMRNRWHEVAYYALAANHAPNGTPSCTTGGTCLSVAGHRDNAGASDAGRQRAVILLSGRTLTGATRPNGTLTDWFEGANADGQSPFEQRSTTLKINRAFNDHFAILSSN
jgi:hypothetical protein